MYFEGTSVDRRQLYLVTRQLKLVCAQGCGELRLPATAPYFHQLLDVQLLSLFFATWVSCEQYLHLKNSPVENIFKPFFGMHEWSDSVICHPRWKYHRPFFCCYWVLDARLCCSSNLFLTFLLQKRSVCERQQGRRQKCRPLTKIHLRWVLQYRTSVCLKVIFL